MFSVTQRPPYSALVLDEPASSSSRTSRALNGMDIDDDYNDLGEGPSRSSVVSPGETITSSKEYMRGHGTYLEEESVISSVAGTIQRVNKLISVKPLKSRYNPEVGDLVIGRIVEVGSSRWKVEANGRQDAVLMLSSVNLPGGVQRRKIESDALKMREFLAEGDLLVAEVQAFFADGAMSLHTRSLKYGKASRFCHSHPAMLTVLKLRNGLLINIPSRLIRRLKSHFHHLPPPCGPTGVDIILGLNGFVWVSLGTTQEKREGGEGFDAEGVYSDRNDEISPEGRKAIADVAWVVQAFATHDVPLSDQLISEGYEWLVANASEKSESAGDAAAGTRMVQSVTGVELESDSI